MKFLDVCSLHKLFVWELPTDFNFKYLLKIYFGSPIVDPTWQAIGIPKSSSLAKGWQKFHMHTTGFEPKTFFEGPRSNNGFKTFFAYTIWYWVPITNELYNTCSEYVDYGIPLSTL
jgi:hypothetical protein